ncbi:MAG: hypothetical protein G01um101430_406 [Parcubacteria group bacterium Gr01-1014_30]|nr:MAG: hypothetical protein G01um101430_406 [Parcubacteria group bacterium Gr01-1014_30]
MATILAIETRKTRKTRKVEKGTLIVGDLRTKTVIIRDEHGNKLSDEPYFEWLTEDHFVGLALFIAETHGLNVKSVESSDEEVLMFRFV